MIAIGDGAFLPANVNQCANLMWVCQAANNAEERESRWRYMTSRCGAAGGGVAVVEGVLATGGGGEVAASLTRWPV